MQAWEQFLQSQEKEIGVETVRRWLRTLRVKEWDACNIHLIARDSFQILWFEEHVRSKVHKTLVNNNGSPIKVHLELADTSPGSKTARSKGKKRAAEPAPEATQFSVTHDELDPLCTFDNFVGAESNLLALKILCEVAGYPLDRDSSSHAESQLAVFNPIYVYGVSGTGKTHLLMATCSALRKQGLNVVYTRAETFTEHVVTAIRAGEMSTFRRAYRNVDVLLIDDVHIFSRKGATQEELFHTFNTLHLAGKQIILSSNCSPQELQLIEPRLVSRFEWGIVMPLEPLKPEELVQVARKKAAALKLTLPPRVEEYLCETFQSSPKALCKSVEALVLRAHLDTKEKSKTPKLPLALSLPAVKDLLSDLVMEEEAQVLKPEHIVQTVAESYGIRTEDIVGRGQTRECVVPRQIAMYLCRQKLRMPFTKIGDLFGRDHSTVMSSVRQIQKKLGEPEDRVGSDLHSILKKLRS